MNQFTILKNQMNLLNQKININNINNQQELKLKNGRYVGQVVNGLREGKGIMYFHNGDRMMGDYYNHNPIGKHVILTRNGEVKINNYTIYKNGQRYIYFKQSNLFQ